MRAYSLRFALAIALGALSAVTAAAGADGDWLGRRSAKKFSGLAFASCEAADLFLAKRVSLGDSSPGIRRSLAKADLNGDGVVDLVTLNDDRPRGEGSVATLLGSGDGTFEPPRLFDVGAGPSDLALADLDGDNVLDAVTVNVTSRDLTLLIGNGDGTFEEGTFFDAGLGANRVVAADVNGDGSLDLITNPIGDLSVRLGNGDGTFQAPVLSPDDERNVGFFEVADLDGDDLPDLIASGFAGISVFRGAGDGTFSNADLIPIDEFLRPLSLADLNGDGDVDVTVAANFEEGEILVLLGNGDGTFQPADRYAVGSNPEFVVSADLNGDGALDLVVNQLADGDIVVLPGDGDGTFGTPVAYPAGNSPSEVVVALIDDDGILDVATATTGGLSLLFGKGDGSLRVAPSFPAGELPISIVLDESNGDGVPDLVTATLGSDGVAVLPGIGDGTFLPFRSFAAGELPQDVAAADFDRDGVTDLVTATRLPSGEGAIALLGGRRDGTFGPPQLFPAGREPRSLLVTDLDRDGLQDVVTTSFFDLGRDLGVLLGNEEGGFEEVAFVDLENSQGAVHVAAGDLNGDEVPDIVTANNGENTLSVLLGVGDGKFERPFALPVRAFVVGVEIADLNGDATQDLVAVTSGANSVSVLLGTGGGRFGPPIASQVGRTPRALKIADFDGDGLLDVATANQGGSDVTVLLGNGDGSFEPAGTFGVGNTPLSLTVGDVDRDQAVDIVAANYLSNDVTVLLNQCPPPARPSVEIDIRPRRKGKVVVGGPKLIPVAILGSSGLNVRDVDVSTLTFGPAKAAPAFDLGGRFVYRLSLRDVNRDGYTDLVPVFRFVGTGLRYGRSNACLSGEVHGVEFEACEQIFVAPPRWVRRFSSSDAATKRSWARRSR